MKLAVIIVNYNVKYFLEQALQSVVRAVAEMPDPLSAEVWVVDNNSTDGSVEMVRQQFPQVRLLANDKNVGFSSANNQAIRASEAEYVLLLNPDTAVGENTLADVVRFMDSHPDAGGLGVKMLDGRGRFLPESKRGFPSPAVAFYKIFGLSRLFPKSQVFGRYHLGFLPKDEVHVVDVLAGAFMLLRRSLLDTIGLLDETFFMYGEDIDLSYRITRAGYRNYYYPYTQILHYKGESTKKSSINYVFVFYRAMIIFARKHLPKQKAFFFSFLINLAIYLRAGLAVVHRIISRLALPLFDFIVIYGLMVFLVHYWERTIKYIDGGRYPDILLSVFMPIYVGFWLFGLFLAKGYQKPYVGKKILTGIFYGTLLISIFYAFLDEHHRFSRALIILGAVLASIGATITRVLLHFLSGHSFSFEENPLKKVLIVGSSDEARRVDLILQSSQLHFSVAGTVAPSDQMNGGTFIGPVEGLKKLVRIYKADEIIFCAKDMAYADIISWMERLSHAGVDFKIVPEGSSFVIGSHSKDEPGDYYAFEERWAISQSENSFNKRVFDVCMAILLLITFPLNCWFVRQISSYLHNLIQVLRGRKSWVGYAVGESKLPVIKKGILSPSDELPFRELDEGTLHRLDYLYARHYSIYKDISIFASAFTRLGRTQ